MDGPTEPPPGLIASLKRVGRTLLAIAGNRVELLLVELEEERHRAVEVLLLVMGAAVLALMTLMVATFLVVVVFWDTHRVAALATMGLLYLVAAAALGWRLHGCLKNWTTFPATLAELKKDKACLEEKP